MVERRDEADPTSVNDDKTPAADAPPHDHVDPAPLLQLDRAVGNAALASFLGDPTTNRRRPAPPSPSAADAAVSRQLARAVLARDETEQREKIHWVAPLGLGTVGTASGAAKILGEIRALMREIEATGFYDFDLLREETETRIAALSSSDARETRFLEQEEAWSLNEFGEDVATRHAEALEAIKAPYVGQLASWREAKPISEADLAALEEAIHLQFARGADEDVLSRTSELLGKAKQLMSEVEKWAGYGADLERDIAGAGKLGKIKDALAKLSGKAGEYKRFVDLVRDVGKLTGKLGNTPAGLDEVAALESGFKTIDFVISKAAPPFLKDLWTGFIYKGAMQCTQNIRALKELRSAAERGPVRELFFAAHRGDSSAPSIKKAPSYDTDEHFPGGQPVLDFMWKLMLAPDSVTAVPAGVEDYFVEFVDQFNAGAGGDELEKDWNLFSRDRAPNIVPWVKRHRDDVWVKLYGAVPKPGS